jgi:hypothetical protein
MFGNFFFFLLLRFCDSHETHSSPLSSSSSSSSNISKIYAAQCIFHSSSSSVERTNRSHDCHMALYSLRDMHLEGEVDILQTDLCLDSMIKRTDLSKRTRVALVGRGNCSFETKSKIAANGGYHALIIVNTDLTVFPPGGTATDLLPTVLVSSSFWTYYSQLCEQQSCPSLNVTLAYGESKTIFFRLSSSFQTAVSSQLHQPLDSPSSSSPYSHLPTAGYCLLSIIVAAVCLVGYVSILEPKTKNPSSSATSARLSTAGIAFISFSLLSLIGLSILLRLGTLRTKKIPSLVPVSNPHQAPISEVQFNHREMDELIFEVPRPPLTLFLLTSVAGSGQCSLEKFL